MFPSGRTRKAVTGAAAGTAAAATTVLGVAARRERRRVADVWDSLEADRGSGLRFDPASVTHLPPVAQRYLKHAIAPGTPLAVRAVVDMHGEIRPGPDDAWMVFRAREVLAPRRGFVWRVQAQRVPLRLSGTDDYVGDSARMRLGLFGFLPVIRGSGGRGSDFARSARGRLVSESCWVPSTFVDDGLHWEAVDDQHVNVAMTVDGEATTLCLSVAQDGALRRTVISRRGDVTDDGAWADIPFAGTVDEERTFGGYTIPGRLRASWWHDTEREFEFFRATVDAADFA